MKRLVLLISVLLTQSIMAQEIKIVSGSYTYVMPEFQTIAEGKATALKYAKIKLLEKTFGTYISSSSFLHDEDGDSRYLQVSESEVKGEWLQTIGEPDYTITPAENDHFLITVHLKGKVREIVRAQTQFQVRVLKNGLDSKFESDTFNKGDYIYLSFRSPVPGFLVVFISDGKNAQCMLPYATQKEGSMKIKAKHDYLFFSTDRSNPGIEDTDVRRYLMNTDSLIEHDVLYLIFSKTEFNKPLVRNGKDFRYPSHISEQSFQDWLSRIRAQDPMLEVVKKEIIILQKDEN